MGILAYFSDGRQKNQVFDDKFKAINKLDKYSKIKKHTIIYL